MMNSLVCTIPHNIDIVSLQEAKAHLFVSHDDEDAYIASLIRLATSLIDGPDGIGVSIAPATYRLSLSSLHALVMPMEKVTSIFEVTVDGEVIDLDTFTLETDVSPPVLYSDTELVSSRPYGVKVTFEAGHDEVPVDLKHAALLIIGHLYRNREQVSEIALHETPFAARMLMDRHRINPR